MSAPRVPPFASAYPEDAELGRLVALFEAGDYLRAREGALALAKDAEPALRDAALDLAARTKPEPSAALFFVFAAFLLLSLAGYWTLHDGPDPHAPKEKPAVEIVK